MKRIIFIGSIVVCHLVVFASAQNCTFAQVTLQASQKTEQARSLYLNELSLEFVTRGQPGFGTWISGSMEQTAWNESQRARTVLLTAEILNRKMYTDRECNDLSPYTDCFSQSDICHDSTGLHCDRNATYRPLGGFCNNLENPKLGAQNSAYGRLIPPDYNDCLQSERRTYIDNIELPSPRTIGNILAENDFGRNFQRRLGLSKHSVLNLLALFLGQIIAHDTGSKINVQRNNLSGPGIKCCSQNYTRRLSEDLSHPACQPIDIPSNDPFYSKFNAKCLNFVSSQITFSTNCKIGPAQQINGVSALLDLTIVYGDDLATESRLRTFKNGQIRTNAANVLPENPNCRQPPCYILGDPRLVQSPMLAQWHSLLLRSHNLIASQIGSNDEITYQEAKRLNIALYQRIVYNEWLPNILGEDFSSSSKLTCDASKCNCGQYNPNVDPITLNEFAHSAFRCLHAVIPSVINLYGVDKNLTMSRPLSEMDARMGYILEQNYDDLIRGLFDPVNFEGFSSELREGFQKDSRGMGTDLLSIDIKRGRNHGLPPFCAYISICTGSQAPVNTWQDLSPYFTRRCLRILQATYKSPRDLDLLVGLHLERRRTPYAVMGKIGICIISEQFKRFQYSDRFFYRWTDGTHPFTQPQLEEIESVTMAKLLCSITSVSHVPRDAFLTTSNTNPMVCCDSLPKFNFTLFSKKITMNYDS